MSDEDQTTADQPDQPEQNQTVAPDATQEAAPQTLAPPPSGVQQPVHPLSEGRETDQEEYDRKQAELDAEREEHNRRIAPGGAEL